jgi:hypothetical protein
MGDSETISYVYWVLYWLQVEKGLPPELALRIVYNDRAIMHPVANIMKNDPILRESAITFAAAQRRAIDEASGFGYKTRRWYDYCFCGLGPAPLPAISLQPPPKDKMMQTTVAHTQRIWDSDAKSLFNFSRNCCDCSQHRLLRTHHCSLTTQFYRLWCARNDICHDWFTLPMAVCHAFRDGAQYTTPHYSNHVSWFKAQPTSTLKQYIVDNTEYTNDDLEGLTRGELLMRVHGWENFRVPLN